MFLVFKCFNVYNDGCLLQSYYMFMYQQMTYYYILYDFEIWANVNSVILNTFFYDLLFTQQGFWESIMLLYESEFMLFHYCMTSIHKYTTT